MNTSRQTALRQSGLSMIEVLVTLIILLVGLLGLAGLMMQSQRSEMESYQRVQALILLQDMAGRINANRLAGASCYGITPSVSSITPYLGTTTSLATPVTVASVPSCTTTAVMADYTKQLNASIDPASTAYSQNLGWATSAAPSAVATALSDLNIWHNALLGAAEAGTGGNAGAMVGARGCISYDPTTELPQLAPTGLPSGSPIPNGQPTGVTIPGTGLYTLSIAWQGMSDSFANTAVLCGKGLYNPTFASTGDDAQRRVVSLTFRIASLL